MIFHRGFIAKILRILRVKYFKYKMRVYDAKLARIKYKQKIDFHKLCKNFSDYYYKLKKYNFNKHTTPLWKKYNTELEKRFLPYPPFSFLQDSTIMLTMFETNKRQIKNKLEFLESKIPKKRLKKILEEDYVGDPLLLASQYFTSQTTVNHLFHAIKFLSATNCKLDNLETIVEWGGGYGSMIKILKRLKQTPTTYIMIDTPLFCCLQWIYLSTVFGEKQVNLIIDQNDKIVRKKINILTIPFLDKFKIKTDLFISTWALSESSKYSQDYVLKRNWFNAKHLFLAYQGNKTGLYDPIRVGKMAKKKGAVTEKIELTPGNYYAFL